MTAAKQQLWQAYRDPGAGKRSACAGIIVQDGRVVDAAKWFHWTVGKRWSKVEAKLVEQGYTLVLAADSEEEAWEGA